MEEARGVLGELREEVDLLSSRADDLDQTPPQPTQGGRHHSLSSFCRDAACSLVRPELGYDAVESSRGCLTLDGGDADGELAGLQANFVECLAR